MHAYTNLSGASNVVAYEILPEGIRVRFRTGPVYTYTIQSAGAHNIAQMQQLAIAGSGLNSFISRYVKKLYASKS